MAVVVPKLYCMVNIYKSPMFTVHHAQMDIW